jgi:hypothetical protein
MAQQRFLLACLLPLALAAAGCGRSADRTEAREVAERFVSALESGDGAAACAQLSQDTRDALEGDEGQPCRQAIGALAIEPAPLARVEVFITNARAELEGGESVFLSETAEGWRISAAGCRPKAGDPADVPLDCELEA